MKPNHITSDLHPWRRNLHLMSTAQREAAEERQRERAEASRERISARMNRIADEVALAEAGPVFALDSTERDAQLLDGLVKQTTCRRLVADE